jgi:hypothetical protein
VFPRGFITWSSVQHMDKFILCVCVCMGGGAHVKIIPVNYCFESGNSVKLCKTFKRPEQDREAGYTGNNIVRLSLLHRLVSNCGGSHKLPVTLL